MAETSKRRSTRCKPTNAVDANQTYRLELLKTVAHALSSVVRCDTEVIVHDLRHPEASIVSIVNGHISNRREGQPIIAGLFGDRAFDAVIGKITSGEPNAIKVVDHYKSHTSDGRVLHSSSVVLFDENAEPQAALCMNVDPTAMDQIQRSLDALTGKLMSEATRSAQTAVDTGAAGSTVDDLVTDIIASALQGFDVPVARLSKQEKVAAVAVMHERGLFMLRSSTEMVAKALGTTKFTIYNYLEEIGRSRESESAV